MSEPVIPRRPFVAGAVAGMAGAWLPRGVRSPLQGRRPRPSAAQLAWQREERSLFLHFGVNTFTDREWGTGQEDPKIFNPTELDCRQWVRVLKDAGMKMLLVVPCRLFGHCVA